MDTLGKSSDTNNPKIRSRTAKTLKCVNLITLCCVLLVRGAIRADQASGGVSMAAIKAALSGDRNSPDRAFTLALHRRTEIVGNSSNAARPAPAALVPKPRHLSNASLITSRPRIVRLSRSLRCGLAG